MKQESQYSDGLNIIEAMVKSGDIPRTFIIRKRADKSVIIEVAGPFFDETFHINEALELMDKTLENKECDSDSSLISRLEDLLK